MKQGDIVVSRKRARFQGREFRCSIGRSGISSCKREGDGATPSGTYRLLCVLYRPDRLHLPWVTGAVPILGNDIWSDDPADPNYNCFVRATADGYCHSHERLRRPDGQYDLVIPTDYNWPDSVPEKGSAIFLHIWRSALYPTAGCVAFSKHDLIWIAERITPITRLVIRMP